MMGGAQHGGVSDWQRTGPWVTLGKRIVFFLLGGLIVFSALVSIAGAVVATGTVTVESSYQEIQSLDGGVVDQILVKNGDKVDKGQPLIRLDKTAAKTNLNAISARVATLRIQQARLIAERDGKTAFKLPDRLNIKNTTVAQAYKSQKLLFEARLKTRNGEQSMLAQRIDQLKGQKSGFEHQLTARKKEREINKRELKTVMPLFERGYVNQQRLTPLQRESARLDGEIGRLQSEVSRISSAISENELRKSQAEKQFKSEVADQLSNIQGRMAEDLQTQKRLAGVLRRTDITAPKSGFVHALTAQTIGGVIRPATRVAQIIPEGEPLVIDARLPPTQIDRVRVGQAAAIQFSAFNVRSTPRLTGRVVKVSPAEVEDSNGRKYFTTRINVPTAELARLSSAQTLVPGMPAEVFIETDARSILSYFLKPLTDSLTHAFRER